VTVVFNDFHKGESMKRLRSSAQALLLVFSILTAACGISELNRIINVTDSVVHSHNGAPSLIESFQLPESTAKEVTSVFDDIVSSVKAYRDDPTEDKFQRALNVFDSAGVQRALARVVNQAWRSRLQGIITLSRSIFTAFGPATAAEMSKDSEDARAARKELEVKIKQLEEMVKP